MVMPPPPPPGQGRVFLGEYQGREVAIKAVHGLRGNTDGSPASRREGMVQVSAGGINVDDGSLNADHLPPTVHCLQFEALLMTLVSGHPNIVETYKCLASWRDMTNEVAAELVAACNKGKVRAVQECCSILIYNVGDSTQSALQIVQYEWFMIMEYCSLGSLW